MKRDLIKKVLSTVLTVSIAAVLFAGCGNSQQTAETETESKASEKVLRIAAQPYPLTLLKFSTAVPADLQGCVCAQ